MATFIIQIVSAEKTIYHNDDNVERVTAAISQSSARYALSGYNYKLHTDRINSERLVTQSGDIVMYGNNFNFLHAK